MSTTEQLLAADGVGLLMRRWDCPNPRARMLLIHGLGEHSGRYEHVGDFFADRGFDITAFDLRGHGASGGNRIDIESFQQYLDDVSIVFEQIPDDRAANHVRPFHGRIDRRLVRCEHQTPA